MANKNEKRSFVMYDSFLEAMKHLSNKDFRECVMKIRDYALEGIDVESKSPMVNVIMELAKPNLDSARKRYMACVENGKKGAEYGQLGGAPKGNQNARKKQPLKQPLDVNANVNVEENVNDNEDVDVNSDVPSGSLDSLSSFSNSSISVLSNKIVNDSEQFEEREKKEAGINAGEYLQDCIMNNLNKLIQIKKGNIPNDNNLFNRTVQLFIDMYGGNRENAVKTINESIDFVIQQGY